LFLKYWYDEEQGKYIGTNWNGGNVYIGIKVDGSDLIHIQAGLNKVIIIKSYEDGDIDLAIGNKIKKVKVVELTDAKASPVHIAVGNKVMALSK
jgi:hypothetical protein